MSGTPKQIAAGYRRKRDNKMRLARILKGNGVQADAIRAVVRLARFYNGCAVRWRA